MSLLNLIIPKYIIRHENDMAISVRILFNSKCLTPIAIGINNNEATRYFRFLLLKIHMSMLYLRFMYIISAAITPISTKSVVDIAPTGVNISNFTNR